MNVPTTLPNAAVRTVRRPPIPPITSSLLRHAVLIIVGAEHRADAFKACRWCIDELKQITPIWKLEHTPAGEVWVEEHP